jgi:hypothetical protein
VPRHRTRRGCSTGRAGCEPITPFTARICTEEVEHRGVVFPAGTIVASCAERANREIGLEQGERFDITADRDSRLLTFGAGAHYCLGTNLARTELEEALTFLAPRLPDLALGGSPRLGGIEGIYGVESLPLTWSARSGDGGPVRPAAGESEAEMAQFWMVVRATPERPMEFAF